MSLHRLKTSMYPKVLASCFCIGICRIFVRIANRLNTFVHKFWQVVFKLAPRAILLEPYYSEVLLNRIGEGYILKMIKNKIDLYIFVNILKCCFLLT